MSALDEIIDEVTNAPHISVGEIRYGDEFSQLGRTKIIPPGQNFVILMKYAVE